MIIDDIIYNHDKLEHELKIALSTMEKTDLVKELREKIKANQLGCPHFSDKYNWAIVNEICPYCGKKLGGQNNEDKFIQN